MSSFAYPPRVCQLPFCPLLSTGKYRFHWIAAVALLPRDDKIYHPLSLRAIADGVAIQSVILSQRDTYFLFNSVFAGANKFDYLDPVVKKHPTKTFVFAGAPRHGMTKRVRVDFSCSIQNQKQNHQTVVCISGGPGRTRTDTPCRT